MIAVLVDALSCFQRYRSDRSRGGRRIVHEAEKWLLSPDRSWPFSFENICDVFNIDPGYLRRRLLREPDKNPAGSIQRVAPLRFFRDGVALVMSIPDALKVGRGGGKYGWLLTAADRSIGGYSSYGQLSPETYAQLFWDEA